MMSKENIEFLKSGGRRYIIGAAKASLKQFGRELLANDWRPASQQCDRLDTGRSLAGVHPIDRGRGRSTFTRAICAAGLGDEPHRVLGEIGRINQIEVVLPPVMASTSAAVASPSRPNTKRSSSNGWGSNLLRQKKP